MPSKRAVIILCSAFMCGGFALAGQRATPAASDPASLVAASATATIRSATSSTHSPQPTRFPAQPAYIPRNTGDPPLVPLDLPRTDQTEEILVFLDEHFDEIRYWRDGETTAPFATGVFDYGTVRIEDGTLSVDPPLDNWAWLFPGTPGAVRNGVIQARVSVDGDGFGGVVGRASMIVGGEAAGTTVGLYACIVNWWGDSGCYVFSDNKWTLLFYDTLQQVDPCDSYTLTMIIADSTLEFRVDGVIIGTIEDTTRTNGVWGIYAQSGETTTSTVSFDFVTIAQLPDDFSLD